MKNENIQKAEKLMMKTLDLMFLAIANGIVFIHKMVSKKKND